MRDSSSNGWMNGDLTKWRFKIDQAIIPGGCTKFIQAPDVVWNKPFKAVCTEKYNQSLQKKESTMKPWKAISRHHLGNELHSGFWSHGHPYLLKLLSNHSSHADLILTLMAKKTTLFIVLKNRNHAPPVERC